MSWIFQREWLVLINRNVITVWHVWCASKKTIFNFQPNDFWYKFICSHTPVIKWIFRMFKVQCPSVDKMICIQFANCWRIFNANNTAMESFFFFRPPITSPKIVFCVLNSQQRRLRSSRRWFKDRKNRVPLTGVLVKGANKWEIERKNI